MWGKLKELKIIRKYDYEKLLISCWVMLLAIWLYVVFSGNYLTIVVNNPHVLRFCSIIDKNVILNTLIRLVMYYLNWVFVIYAILQEKLLKYKPLQISLLIFIFWFIKTLLINFEFVNYLDFVFFGVLAFLIKRKWYRALIGALLVFIFTFVSNFIKNVFIPNIDFVNVPSLIAMVTFIDIYLMSLIYYLTEMYRKENNYGKLVHFLQIKEKMENYFLGVGKSISSCFRRNSVSISEVKSKLYDFYCGLVFTIVTYLSLLIIGIIFNRWLEMSVSVAFFHIFRGDDEETYHAKHDIKCWLVSMFNFCVIMKLTLPLYISYIVSIALSMALCFIMRIVYLFTNKNMRKRDKLIKIIGKENIDNEEYICKLCNQLGFKDKYGETIYLYLHNTIEETASILEIDNSTITRRLIEFLNRHSL